MSEVLYTICIVEQKVPVKIRMERLVPVIRDEKDGQEHGIIRKMEINGLF